ncbi:hypothetical protein ABH927_001602 [Planotetraspora sp. GP83]
MIVPFGFPDGSERAKAHRGRWKSPLLAVGASFAVPDHFFDHGQGLGHIPSHCASLLIVTCQLL